MPIKKSFLEQKWYYRVGNVLFLALPWVAAGVLIWKGYLGDITQKNISTVFEQNFIYILYGIVGLVLYYQIPILFFYLAFGGIQDDTKSKAMASQSAPANNLVGIPIVIIIIVVVISILYTIGSSHDQKSDDSGTRTTHAYGSACTDGGKRGLYGTSGTCYTCPTGTPSTSRGEGCSAGKGGVYCCTSSPAPKCVPTQCDSIGAWYCVGKYYLGGVQLQFNGCSHTSDMRSFYSGWSGSCRKCP